MISGHFRDECWHGFVYGQCRCPSLTKSVCVVPCPDDEMHRSVQVLDSWAASAPVASPKLHDEGSGL